MPVRACWWTRRLRFIDKMIKSFILAFAALISEVYAFKYKIYRYECSTLTLWPVDERIRKKRMCLPINSLRLHFKSNQMHILCTHKSALVCWEQLESSYNCSMERNTRWFSGVVHNHCVYEYKYIHICVIGMFLCVINIFICTGWRVDDIISYKRIFESNQVKT